MANKSAQNTSIFKKAFGLLKSDTAIEAGVKAVGDSLNNRLKNAQEALELVGQASQKGIDPGDQAKILETLKDTYGFKGVKEGDNIADELLNFRNTIIENVPDIDAFNENPAKFIRNDLGSHWDFGKAMIKDYYTNGTAAERGARIGVTAGAYIGGALGMRMLAGGTATRNSKGERDVAGIPFI